MYKVSSLEEVKNKLDDPEWELVTMIMRKKNPTPERAAEMVVLPGFTPEEIAELMYIGLSQYIVTIGIAGMGFIGFLYKTVPNTDHKWSQYQPHSTFVGCPQCWEVALVKAMWENQKLQQQIESALNRYILLKASKEK